MAQYFLGWMYDVSAGEPILPGHGAQTAGPGRRESAEYATATERFGLLKSAKDYREAVSYTQ